MRRWAGWWSGGFAELPFWRAECGRFAEPVARERLPESLLERFSGSVAAKLLQGFGIDRATAYRRLRRAERLVRDGVIKAVRAETCHLNSEELDELLGQSCCDLHVDDIWGADAMR